MSPTHQSDNPGAGRADRVAPQSASASAELRPHPQGGHGSLMLDEVEREMGRRLRWLRRARGMTQDALADPCGVSFQQIQKYETATSRISAAMLLRIAAALHVDVRFFYEGMRERSFAPAGQAHPRTLVRAS
jgi:DNA-binding XRE family transcriptional regulator